LEAWKDAKLQLYAAEMAMAMSLREEIIRLREQVRHQGNQIDSLRAENRHLRSIVAVGNKDLAPTLPIDKPTSVQNEDRVDNLNIDLSKYELECVFRR
jgi:hypothetical protein